MRRTLLSAAALVCALATSFVLHGPAPVVGTGQSIPAAKLSDFRDSTASAALAIGDTLVRGSNFRRFSVGTIITQTGRHGLKQEDLRPGVKDVHGS